MQEPTILVVGSVNTDKIMQIPHLPQPGETVGGGVYVQKLGGKGANQAVAATRGGGKVAMIGCVGTDAEGLYALTTFSNEGILVEGMIRSDETHTGIAMIWVDEQGENMITLTPGANHRLRSSHLETFSTLFSLSQILLVQLEIPFEVVERAIQIGKQSGLHIILNAAPAYPLPGNLFSNIDTLVVNQTELKIMAQLPVSNPNEIDRAMKKVLDYGIQHLILTLGKDGSILYTSESQLHIPAFQVQAIDTTGAGDIYCGNLAVAIAEGKSMQEAITYASAAAALSVMRLGALDSAPHRKDTLKFLSKA